MNERSAAPEMRRLSRRGALVGVGATAALIAGSGLYRWRASSTDVGRAAFSPHPAPRAVAPLRFTDERGSELTLAAFRGRVVLLNVWATWCPPCREEMPTLDRLQAALGGPTFEVVTLSIDSEGLPAVQAFFRQIGVKHLHPYLDSFHEATQLAMVGVPLTLLIDRKGRERARKIGPATWDGPAMVATIGSYIDDEER